MRELDFSSCFCRQMRKQTSWKFREKFEQLWQPRDWKFSVSRYLISVDEKSYLWYHRLIYFWPVNVSADSRKLGKFSWNRFKAKIDTFSIPKNHTATIPFNCWVNTAKLEFWTKNWRHWWRRCCSFAFLRVWLIFSTLNASKIESFFSASYNCRLF